MAGKDGCAGGWRSFTCNGLHAMSDVPSKIAVVNLTASRTMWVIFLEMGVALGLLLLIVWWTWPKKPGKGKDEP